MHNSFSGDDYVETYQQNLGLLRDAHGEETLRERDACGVGLVVAMDGKPRREIVSLALQALKSVWHRGAVDADGKTGDGAGVRVDVPQDFFIDEVRRTGHEYRHKAPICVGQIFLPRTDFAAAEQARTIVESEILRAGLYIYGWRQVPVNVDVIGEKANATRPEIEQILFVDPRPHPDEGSQERIERMLYVVRRRIETRAIKANIAGFYICSFSSRSLIYKGMFLAEHIDAFYPDLADPRFISAVAIYHQRYSTNTFPTWRLAQPFRMLAHNGEINTLRGNRNWMKSHEIRMVSEAFGDLLDASSPHHAPSLEGNQDAALARLHHELKPIIAQGASDSEALDNVFELLVRAGRTAPMAKALLIPEATGGSATHNDGLMKPAHRALYAYCNSVMEPWDGPAALAMFDGRWAVAGMDRNGLRPMRYARTHDNILVAGSEAGLCALPESRFAERGRIHAGRMIAVDIKTGKFYREDALIDVLASQHPYQEWLKNIVELEPKILYGEEPIIAKSRSDLMRRQYAAGFTFEDLELILNPMGAEGKEAIGSMGDDTPLAVLSDIYRPLAHYFRQNFSQVTNPPIDPVRETRVMSLRTRFKNLGNILAQSEKQTRVFVLESPFLSNLMFDRMLDIMGEEVHIVDCTFVKPDNPEIAGDALRQRLDEIRLEAEYKVSEGKCHIVLTDQHVSADRIAIPMVLAVGGVHSHLVKAGLRSFCSINVRSSEVMDPHSFAVLIGLGATSINPYLALDSLWDRHARGLFGELSKRQIGLHYKQAIEQGLLKILSKMGIAVVSSYRGAYLFEALGLSRALVDEFFPGMTSRISGLGLEGIAQECVEHHALAFDPRVTTLPVGGFFRARANSERHALDAKLIHLLQEACTHNRYKLFQRYAELTDQRPAPIYLRDLLDFKSGIEPMPLDRVEAVNAIRRRFVTPGMSLGALSPEAHRTLNIAMNRIGARSVSGEGGENPIHYQPLANGDNANSAVKQIASGRFGVTTEYLNQCQEIEIKIAQGAKPGEGGQLPGFKVTELIARLRHATPGVTLISPPPHHDIYSIEDLAQLIYDLKQVNPVAKIAVKLVAQSGVGAVAVGVAKARADIILISGHVGGTGASPQSSIKHAGIPWELGLAEVHQILTLNGLRDRVTLRADGGLRTGRDIVMAALLGAEEFGIGTASLVAMGCLMVRQCHSNTCPVGVCTQDEELRKRFDGSPEKVINLMTFIAENVRETLSQLGLANLDQAIGRTDLLFQKSRGAAHLDDLDLNPLLVRVQDRAPMRPTAAKTRNEVTDALDALILRDAAAFFERNERLTLHYDIRNTDRTIGTRISSEIYRRWGVEGRAPGSLHVRLEGSAGQSLGAFGMRGLELEVVGEANDYVGKGLSGADIIIRPHEDAPRGEFAEALIGNTVLYGATSGRLFCAGEAGERFCVRNSGAIAVVEGVSANGCEYMTGGEAAILGAIGPNFAAGMTGGRAFLWDPDRRFGASINRETVHVRRLTDIPGHQAARADLHALLTQHVSKTASARAREVLAAGEAGLSDFWLILPKEVAAGTALASDFELEPTEPSSAPIRPGMLAPQAARGRRGTGSDRAKSTV